MKYPLLVYQSQESLNRRDSAAAIAAGRAYGEALQAAGVFVGGAGLESPNAATTVSVREGKRHVQDGPYAETKEFLAGFGIIDVPDRMPPWSGPHGIPPSAILWWRSARCWDLILPCRPANLPDEGLRDACRH